MSIRVCMFSAFANFLAANICTIHGLIEISISTFTYKTAGFMDNLLCCMLQVCIQINANYHLNKV